MNRLGQRLSGAVQRTPDMNTTTLTAGDAAPDFSGIAVGAEFAEGKPFRLCDYFDEQIVLYFYPQDHTPGCTAQACKLRDAWAEFGSRATLFGISTDSPESHRAFIELNSLPFPLISYENQYTQQEAHR